MLISVDLPAPFSPMMPVIEPRATVIDTARLAWTVPNDLSIDLSSMAGGAFRSGGIGAGLGRRHDVYDLVGAGVVAHVVAHLDLAGDDVGLGLVELGLHLGREQLFVVLVERPVDAALLE